MSLTAKKSSAISRGKQSSRKGKPTNVDTLEVFDASSIQSPSASSSSSAAHQESNEILSEENHLELCACSDGKTLLCDREDTSSSPGQTFSKDSQDVKMMPELPPDNPRGVEPLLPELVDDIIGRIGSMREVMRLLPELGKAFRDVIHRPAFLRNRRQWEGEFSPSFFMTDDEGDLHWYGYDTLSKEWTRLPSLNFAKTTLPSPDPDLFKDYLVAGDGGLLCMNVGKAPGREKLVICNPLTKQVKVLPPLKHPRHPVLMHLKVDHDTGHYKVIVAGSAAIDTETLSLKMEEYDSRKGVWECPDGSDMPCPPFGLNEYQNGVYYTDFDTQLLCCIAFVDGRGRGVLMYDVKRRKWVHDDLHVKALLIPLMRSEAGDVAHLASSQIAECGGSTFVFSEQESGWDTYFLIHKLVREGNGDFTWDEVMKCKWTGGRGLVVYREFTCVPVSEYELCIFSTVEHTIEIIDFNNPTEVKPLLAGPKLTKGPNTLVYSLNPIGFVFKPSFRSVVCPRGRNFRLRCDGMLDCEYCSECQRRGSDLVVSTGIRTNVGPKAVPFVKEAAPTNATTTLGFDLGGSEEALIENAGKVIEEIRNFLDQLFLP